MIARDLGCGPAANQVTAGIAGAGGPAELIDARIGGLNEARHQYRVCFTPRGGTKTGDQSFDGGLGGDFTSVFAPDAVGDGEKPAVSAAVEFGGWRPMAGVVLIVVAHAAYV